MNRRLIRWGLGLDACLTLGLIGLGSFVSSSGYGLAIPEWPLIDGGLVPAQLVAGIWYEFLHRTLAATAGLLTLGLGGWIVLRDERGEVRRLALTAMVLVTGQILLGGLGVLWEFPLWLESLHALAAPLFFVCLVVLITLFSREWEQGTRLRFSVDALGKTRNASVLLLFQIVLGVGVRHAPQMELFMILLALHLITALAVVALVIGMAVSILKRIRSGPVGIIAVSSIPLVLLQLAIGLAVLALSPEPGHGEGQADPIYVAHAVAHALTAALLLATSTYLAMMVRRKNALARPPRVIRVETPGLVDLE